MDIISVLLPQARAGTIRAVAVTSRERLPSAPDIPTVSETLKGFEAVAWIGMMAPARTPRQIVDKLAAAVARIVTRPEVRTNLDAVGGVAAATTPDELVAFLTDEHARSEVVLRGLGLIHSNQRAFWRPWRKRCRGRKCSDHQDYGTRDRNRSS
jgi:tripartite-type tricarboxylate transporter receptor subunit TctC